MPLKYSICLLVAVQFVCSMTATAETQSVPSSFQRIELSNKFFAEGATVADLNRDGHGDVIAGPYWFAGPDFKQRHSIYPAKAFDIDGYSDNFFAFAYDFDNDGWQDLLFVGFPGQEAKWYRNPGTTSKKWEPNLAFSVVDNESPHFTDITGDDRPELVFITAGKFGYAEIPQDPTKPWEFVPISDDRGNERFTHGLGVGDVNRDGKPDILEKSGWWEQPTTQAQGKTWTYHRVPFAERGGAQMLVYDFDGDGDNDVLTSKDAHGFGLSWFENTGAQDRELNFTEHLIMGSRPEEGSSGIAVSELHALALEDIDGDGVKDFITGKRFWSHRDQSPGALEPASLYWFKTVRANSSVQFIPHLIDVKSGVGTQVVATDANGDDRMDVVVANKNGIYLFLKHDN